MKIKAKAALTAAAFSAAAVMSFSGCENEVAAGVYGPPPDMEYNNTVTESQTTEEEASDSEIAFQTESEDGSDDADTENENGDDEE